MKIILNESKLESAIESGLKSNFPIVSVKFKNVQVVLGSTEGQPIHTQRKIIIIADPLDIMSGDLKALDRDPPSYDFRIKILTYLQDWFSLDYYTYASKWDVEIYFLRLSRN